MTFTPEQQETVDFILEQIDAGSSGKNVVVSGQGGVGKTEMVTELVCILLARGNSVAVSAMTGKATSVLRNKIVSKLQAKKMFGTFPKENLYIETIQKLTKTSKVLGTSESGDTLYSNQWRDPETFKYDVLIIDELSMVPHFVSLWWKKTGARIIGLGDFCQLPEVTTADTLRELESFSHDLHIPQQKFIGSYGINVLRELSSKQLTKVLRSENEIALLCNDLRNFTQPKQKVISTIKEWSAKSDNISYSTSLDDLETGKDWQIICYANKTCREINKRLSIGDDYPDIDDKVLLFDNLNPLRLYNGDVVIFKDLLQTINNHNMANPSRRVYVCLKWQGQMPRKDSPYALERGFFQSYVDFKKVQEKVMAERIRLLPEILRSCGSIATPQADEWIRDIATIQQAAPNATKAFTEIVERLQVLDISTAQYIAEAVPPIPRLYMIGLDFGYAITTHKSQGSEYPNVCYVLERFDRPLLYTGVSRAKEKVKIINLTSTR